MFMQGVSVNPLRSSVAILLGLKQNVYQTKKSTPMVLLVFYGDSESLGFSEGQTNFVLSGSDKIWKNKQLHESNICRGLRGYYCLALTGLPNFQAECVTLETNSNTFELNI